MLMSRISKRTKELQELTTESRSEVSGIILDHSYLSDTSKKPEIKIDPPELDNPVVKL